MGYRVKYESTLIPLIQGWITGSLKLPLTERKKSEGRADLYYILDLMVLRVSKAVH